MKPPRMLAGTLVALVAAAAMAATPASAARNATRVFSSGNQSELIKKLPITARPGAKPRKAMRIGPGRVPDLHAGDVLRTGAELQLTNSCAHPEPSCIGPSYRFSPKVEASSHAARPGRPAPAGNGQRELRAVGAPPRAPLRAGHRPASADDPPP